MDWHDQPKQPEQRWSCHQNPEVCILSPSKYSTCNIVLLSRRINHPSYGGSPPDYDFQLIELSSTVNFADPQLSHVFPACWPTSEPTSGRVLVHICCCCSMKIIIYYPFSSGCHFRLGNNQLRWQSANNFAEGMWCTTFILRLLKTGIFFRQMSRLSQGAHATTYQPTEAELQTRWSAWASWRVELILARRVTNPTVSHFNSN